MVDKPSRRSWIVDAEGGIRSIVVEALVVVVMVAATVLFSWFVLTVV